MVEIVQAIATALLVVLGAAALGMPFSKWGAPPENEMDQAARALGCGFVLLSYLTLLLGSLGALYSPIIAAVLIGPLLLPGRGRQVIGLFLAAGRLFRQRLGSGWMGAYSALVLVAVAVCGLTPNTNFDVESYHYAFPQIYLRQASLEWAWSNLFEGFVQSVHMLYVAAIALGGELGANLLAPVFLVMLLGTAMDTCSDIEHEASPIVAFLLLSSPLILFQGLGGLVDLPLSAYTWMAMASLLKARHHSGHLGWSALWCGAALSSKVTSVAGLVCLLISTRWYWPGRWRRKVALLLLVMGMMSAPWWIRNYVYTGDPLSPLFTNWQTEQWNWNPLKHFVPPAHAASKPEVKVELVTAVRSWEGFRPLQDSVNFLIWLSPLLLLAGINRRVGGLGVPAMFAAIPCVMLCGKDMRYAMPIITWWSVISAVVLARGQQRWPRFTSLAIYLSCLPGVAVLLGILYLRLPVVVGLQSKEAFLEQRGPQSAYRYLDQQARSGRQVIVVGRLGFRCPLKYYCADSLPIQEWPKVYVSLDKNTFEYFVLDLRDLKVLRSLLIAAVQTSQKRVVQPEELCRGPLQELGPELLKSWLLKWDYAEVALDGLHLHQLTGELNVLESVSAAALRRKVLFSKDGVIVLGPPQVKEEASGAF